MVVAKVGDVIVAESDACEVIDGNYYFPPDSIKKEYFSDSKTKTTCGWKGQASYYTINVNDQKITDAAWYYPEPKPAVEKIKCFVAFYGSKVTVQKE
eukprot:Nk52_evm31s292 gene=Nk52_evmTU31s292